MKVTLKNGGTVEAVSVEESFTPRSGNNTVLSIRMDQDDDVDALRNIFTPEETSVIQVESGEKTATFTGYTQIDSVRRIFDGMMDYNAVVDLVKPA